MKGLIAIALTSNTAHTPLHLGAKAVLNHGT